MSFMQLKRLEQSVAKLERQNRWYRLIASLIAVCAISLLIMGQSSATKSAKIIEAEKFVLRDQSGVVRAVLKVESNDGIAALALADKTGKAVTELVARGNGETGLRLADASGTTRVALRVKGGNSPDLALADADGALRLAMGIDPAGNPALVLYDENERPIWKPIWRTP